MDIYVKKNMVILLNINLRNKFTFCLLQMERLSTWNKSAQNAINNLDLIMNIDTSKLIDKNNQEKLKIKDEYIGDEITKYGLHTVFCEIPGTLPSEKANPKSYSNFIGVDCYRYYSQRRYLDPDDPSYICR